MVSWYVVALVGIPLAWHLALTAFAFYDAPRIGLDRRKWTIVVGLVPLFGFFAYGFERYERDYDPEDDPYAQGRTFAIHPSREDEDPFYRRVDDEFRDDEPEHDRDE